MRENGGYRSSRFFAASAQKCDFPRPRPLGPGRGRLGNFQLKENDFNLKEKRRNERPFTFTLYSWLRNLSAAWGERSMNDQGGGSKP